MHLKLGQPPQPSESMPGMHSVCLNVIESLGHRELVMYQRFRIFFPPNNAAEKSPEALQ